MTTNTMHKGHVMKKILFMDHSEKHQKILFQKVHEELDENDSEMLLVLKPNLQIMMTLCEKLEIYKGRLVFVIQINSINTSILKLVDPYSPYSIDRLSSLKFAFENGFRTAIEAIPLFDNGIFELIKKVKEFVTDFIHVDKLSESYVNTFPIYNVQQLLRSVSEFYKSSDILAEIYEKFGDDEQILLGDNFEKSFQNLL